MSELMVYRLEIIKLAVCCVGFLLLIVIWLDTPQRNANGRAKREHERRVK